MFLINFDNIFDKFSEEDGEAKRRNSFTRVPKCWESPSASSATDVEKRVVENCGSVVIFTSYSE